MRKFLKRLNSLSRESLNKDSDLKSCEDLNLVDSNDSDIRERDLNKLGKAIWNGDMTAFERHLTNDQLTTNKYLRFIF